MNRTIYRRIFAVSAALFAVSLIAGCAGTFFSEAPSVIQAIIGSVAAIAAALSFVPGLGTEAAAISAILTAADNEASEIEMLIQQYQTTPNETTLQKIEAAIQLAISNMTKLLSPLNIPPALATKIGNIAQVMLDQFEAWAALIASIKVPASGKLEVTDHAKAAAAMSKLLTAKQYKTRVNDILDTPTGDATVDAAFARSPRL